jgi:hypothetical protein
MTCEGQSRVTAGQRLCGENRGAGQPGGPRMSVAREDNAK